MDADYRIANSAREAGVFSSPGVYSPQRRTVRAPGGRRPVRPLGFVCLVNPGWRGRARCAIRGRSTPGYLLTGLQPEEPSTDGFLRLARSRLFV